MLKYLLFWYGFIFALPADAEGRLTFGVIPGLPATTLEERFGPLIMGLEKHLGVPIEFRTRKSFAAFTEALVNEEFDIAVINGIDFITVYTSNKYEPLVRKKGDFHAVLVSFNPSITKLTQLRGTTIAFPPEQAAISFIMQRYLLQQGLDSKSYQAHYFDEHASCIFAATNGSATACATSQVIASELRKSQQDRMVIVSETPAYPQLLIVVHRRIDNKFSSLQQWFLHLHDSPGGRAILQQTFLDEVDVVDVDDYLRHPDLIEFGTNSRD